MIAQVLDIEPRTYLHNSAQKLITLLPKFLRLSPSVDQINFTSYVKLKQTKFWLMFLQLKSTPLLQDIY